MVDGVRGLSMDRGAELLGESRQPRIAGNVPTGVLEYRRAQRRKLQIAKDSAHVAKRFMKSGRFLAAGVEKLWLYGIENGVAHFVTDDVRACAGEHHAVGRRAVKKIERLSLGE